MSLLDAYRGELATKRNLDNAQEDVDTLEQAMQIAVRLGATEATIEHLEDVLLSAYELLGQSRIAWEEETA